MGGIDCGIISRKNINGKKIKRRKINKNIEFVLFLCLFFWFPCLFYSDYTNYNFIFAIFIESIKPGVQSSGIIGPPGLICKSKRVNINGVWKVIFG